MNISNYDKTSFCFTTKLNQHIYIYIYQHIYIYIYVDMLSGADVSDTKMCGVFVKFSYPKFVAQM